MDLLLDVQVAEQYMYIYICMYIYFLSNDNLQDAHIYKIKSANLFDMTKRDSEN